MRVKLFDRYHPALGMRDGVIKERSWGRDRGKPIWWFVVAFDGDSDKWVFGPGEIAAGVENAKQDPPR
jgi:hypothetical protein